MKIPKSSLEVLFNVLKETDGALTLPESRKRDILLKEVQVHYQQLLDDRHTILKKFGKTETQNENGTITYSFDPADQETVNQEIKTLYDEEVEVNTPVGTQAIVDKSTYKFKIGEAELFPTL